MTRRPGGRGRPLGDITRASGTDAAKRLPPASSLVRLRGRASLADASGCLQRLGVSKKQYFAAAEFLDLAAQVRASVGRAPVTLTAQTTAEWVGRLRALLAPVADLGADESPGLLAPGVYLGSYAHAQNVELLASLGVTAVLNCAPSMCDGAVAEYEARGWSYAAVDAQDQARHPLLDQHLATAREFLSGALDQGVAFVHCFQGVQPIGGAGDGLLGRARGGVAVGGGGALLRRAADYSAQRRVLQAARGVRGGERAAEVTGGSRIITVFAC